MNQHDESIALPGTSESDGGTNEGADAVMESAIAVADVADPLVENRAERESARSEYWEWVALAVVFFAVYAILFILYRPQLLLSQTTTSGGDMGAHHYPAKWMIENIRHFRLTGWTMQWYAGMPMFTFYLPLPFLLIALLNFVLPYTVAFKLATVAGVFALPLVAYAYGRLFRIRRPFALLAAVFALLFLLMESYSIYGGNILSTLAGEFGYSISFALTFLFLGTLYRGLERPRFDALFALNGLILMCVVLTHIVTVMALVVVAPSLLLLHRRWRAVSVPGRGVRVGLLALRFLGHPLRGQAPVECPHGLGPAAGLQGRPSSRDPSGDGAGGARHGLCGGQARPQDAASGLDHRAGGGGLLRPARRALVECAAAPLHVLLHLPLGGVRCCLARAAVHRRGQGHPGYRAPHLLPGLRADAGRSPGGDRHPWQPHGVRLDHVELLGLREEGALASVQSHQ